MRYVAAPSIAFQQALALQEMPDSVSNGVRQVRQLSTLRRLYPANSDARSILAIDVNTIEKKYMGRSCSSMRPRLDQVCGNAAIHDTEHFAHNCRTTGKQESQRLRQQSLRTRALGGSVLIFAAVAMAALWQYREANANAVEFYELCDATRAQVTPGINKLNRLGEGSDFGRLVSGIAKKVAQLTDPDSKRCGDDPSLIAHYSTGTIGRYCFSWRPHRATRQAFEIEATSMVVARGEELVHAL
jgi:hypothetical protein